MRLNSSYKLPYRKYILNGFNITKIIKQKFFKRLEGVSISKTSEIIWGQDRSEKLWKGPNGAVTVDRSISWSDQITEIHTRKLAALKKYGSRASRRSRCVFTDTSTDAAAKREWNVIIITYYAPGEVTASVTGRNRNFREQVAVEKFSFSLHVSLRKFSYMQLSVC